VTREGTVQDFAIAPRRDLRECPWWRPLTVSLVGRPREDDRILGSFLPSLLEAFRDQGHRVLDRADGDVELMLGFSEVPDGDEPLVRRIPERETPLALALLREFGLSRRPENLVVLASTADRLAERAHMEIVEAARAAMARIGTPKVVFVTGDRATGEVVETTYCTMEGGHPTDVEDHAALLRDRLVTMACATEVGGRYEVVPDALPRDVWEGSGIPDALMEAGRRMDGLDLLPPPRRLDEFVGPELTRKYNRFLGLKGFSEGMLFAVDPDTGTTMVTASGSWDVDKRTLRRDEVVPINLKDDMVVVLAPEGIKPKGPSVEAWEVLALLEAVPKARIARDGSGTWVPDPDGPVEVPIVRGGIHTHVGVERIDEDVVEVVPANRELFPYGFGCGTDLMCDVARDVALRSRAIQDPDDPRRYVRWPMLYHGDAVVELWKPGVGARPLEGLLDLYDPDRSGVIHHTPDHIHQPV
jgi:hypothetical protein